MRNKKSSPLKCSFLLTLSTLTLSTLRNLPNISAPFLFPQCVCVCVCVCVYVCVCVAIDVHHVSLRCTAWWFDLPILWNNYHNRLCLHPSFHTVKNKIAFSCDENSAAPLLSYPLILIFHNNILILWPSWWVYVFNFGCPTYPS